MPGDIISIGRINIDVNMRVKTLPKVNEHMICEKGRIAIGGSAANFATQSARLGSKTSLVSCLGDDAYGQLAMKEIANAGVDTNCLLVLEKQPTGIFFYAHDSKDERIVVVEPGANRFLEKHLFEEDSLVDAQLVHVAGSFPMMINRVSDVTTTHGMILSLDPGRAAGNLDYEKILRRTDLLFVTQRELKDYFKITPTEKQLRALAKTFPGIVVLKMGEKGAIATDGFEYCTSDVFEVPVVDTLGAGDSFAAGFVTAWMRSERIEQALNVANAVAALTITKAGTQNGQPTLDDVARLLRRHQISIDSILKTFRPKTRRKPRGKKTKSRR
ncbi:MAG: carbohydrate kinase family protein [Candidatus Thorarchaeota archaeon]|nr:MAG: carbohydrate kinase family protein [Candidatus Thorarchaeota archaeon]